MSSNSMATENERTDEILFPYEVSFVDCPPSDAVRYLVEEHLTKLSRLYARITSCKVAVRIPHKHSGNRFYHIHILLDVPGKQLAVTREPEAREQHTEIQSAIHDAFHKMTRQLEDFIRIRKSSKAGKIVLKESEF